MPSNAVAPVTIDVTNIDSHDALGLGKDVLLNGDVNADSFFVQRGWTHRRSERRLEGPRHVVQLLDVHAVAPGRRQGHAAEGRQVPDAARSACEMNGSSFGGLNQRLV